MDGCTVHLDDWLARIRPSRVRCERRRLRSGHCWWRAASIDGAKITRTIGGRVAVARVTGVHNSRRVARVGWGWGGGGGGGALVGRVAHDDVIAGGCKSGGH